MIKLNQINFDISQLRAIIELLISRPWSRTQGSFKKRALTVTENISDLLLPKEIPVTRPAKQTAKASPFKLLKVYLVSQILSHTP